MLTIIKCFWRVAVEASCDIDSLNSLAVMQGYVLLKAFERGLPFQPIREEQ